MPRYTAFQKKIVGRVKRCKNWQTLTLGEFKKRLKNISITTLKRALANAAKEDVKVKQWSESSDKRRSSGRGVREIKISGEKVRLTGKEIEIFSEIKKIRHFKKFSAKSISKMFSVDPNTIHALMRKLVKAEWPEALEWKEHEKMINPSLSILQTKKVLRIQPQILKILPKFERMRLGNISGHKLSEKLNVSRNALSKALTLLAINGHKKALDFKKKELNRTYNKSVQEKIKQDIKQGEMAIKRAKLKTKMRKLEIDREKVPTNIGFTASFRMKTKIDRQITKLKRDLEELQ